MGHSVIIWRVTSTFTGTAPGSGGPYTFASGSYIHSILDDATNTLIAKYSSTSADDTGFEITGGPSLFSDPTGAVQLITVAPFYQYCEGTTLHQVGTSNGWPYATLSNNENNSECTLGSVCDLDISSEYLVTPVSAPGANDGSILGSASSSNGLIKYSFDPNFPYGSSTSGGTLPPLEDWEIGNTSSEPFVWTIGPQPYAILTPPSIQNPVLSDIYRTPYSTAWVAGQTYTFPYDFKAESANSNFVNISFYGYDYLMNPLVTWGAYGWGSPAGVSGGTFDGVWSFTAPAGMVHIGIVIAMDGPAGYNKITILQFGEIVVADPPSVKTTLDFSGLYAGTYTVYAKDAAGCQDSLSFVIGVTTVNNIRYRLEFKDSLQMSGYFHRVDIIERGYAGEIEEVCGGGDPVVVSYKGDSNDPSKPLIASNMELMLMCNENEQFSDIFLADDRKYQVKYYTDNNELFTSPDLYWTGWVVPEFYSEPYIAPPFPVTITVSDQIGEFKNMDFLDEAGNKFKGEMSIIKILAAIFKQTNLNLPFRCGVNVWADLMNQDDDPLRQAFLDVRIFEGKKCDYVLQEIAKAFRGQIFQSQGYWWFIRLSDAVGTFQYREYDVEGVQVGADELTSIKELVYPSVFDDIDGVFSQKSQILGFMRNYGKFSISHDLQKDGNIIDEGRFEEDDIEIQGSGNIGFKRWSVTLGQSGVHFGLEKVENGDSKGAFYFDYSSAGSDQNDTVLYSEVLPLENFGGKIRFKFQYMVSPKFKAAYIRLAWALKLTADDGENWWFGQGAAGNWTIYNTEVKNNIYVTSYDSWQSFDLLLDWPTLSVWANIQIFFYFHDHKNRDFEDVAALQAFSLPTSPIDMKVMVKSEDDPLDSWVYKAEYAYDAEDVPTVVYPPGYNAGDSNHRVLWKRESIFGPLSVGQGLINRFKFDNVGISIYPAEPTNAQIIDPPQTLTYTQTVDSSNKSNLELPVLIGDMLRIDEETGHYRNERYIYRSYIRMADGTPTEYWHRIDVPESKRLLRITLEDYMAQFSTPQRKLSGSIVSSSIMHYINSIRDSYDMARYRPMTFSFDVKRAEYTIDMSAVNGGPDGEPPVILGAFNRKQFSEAFDIGNGL